MCKIEFEEMIKEEELEEEAVELQVAKDWLEVECLSCKKKTKVNDIKHSYCSDQCKSQLYACECSKCLSEFFGKYKAAKYCSDDCRTTECILCNNIFKWINSPVEKYCSNKCKVKHLTKDCLYCENEFYSPTNNKFCSKECQKGYQKEKKNHNICKSCKKVLVYSKDFWTPEFCGEECQKKHAMKRHKEKLRKNNPKMNEVEDVVSYRVNSIIARKNEFLISMKHGLDYNLLNNFNESHKQRILEREKYSCYICEHDHDLEVHHILPRRLGGNNDDDNLVALCVKCHRAVETGDLQYATKKCTERAKRNFGLVKLKSENRMNKKEFAATLEQELNVIFNKVNDSETKEEIMINIDDLIDHIVEWKMSK